MKKHYYLILLSAIALFSFKSDKPAYHLFDQDGKVVKYSKMIKELVDADIIFFGELHTDPIAHWMQVELTKDLFNRKPETLILGAEMFEADNQLILDEYLNDVYPAKKFEAEMRLWGNYETDYKPLVEFARENHIPFIATNIPRRYASIVHQNGFEALDSLSAEAKEYIAPLPIHYDPEVKCYKDMLSMEVMGMPKKDTAMSMEVMGMPKHVNQNLPKAQAAKDATMAHFILENWTDGKILIHFNGSYHSDNFEGIIWHLQQQNEELKIMTISTVLQQDIDTLEEENVNIANYILCVPESMTRTNR